MSKDLDNLELTYKKIAEISCQIAQLVERELYTEIVTYVKKKEQLLKEAQVLVDRIKNTKEDASRLKELCLKINNQEKENIKKLSELRADIKKELSQTVKNKKLLSAYSSFEKKKGNILDYTQ